MNPRHSIICTAYNSGKYIDEAIASVLAQSETDWELIIVDDGSTDDTLDRIRRFRDDRIVLIEQPNAGHCAARNVGMAASRGERLILLDHDDYLHVTAVARLDAGLDAHDAVASYGQCFHVAEDGQMIRPTYRPRPGFPPSGDLLSLQVTRNLFVNGGHVCIKAAVARDLGGFNTGLAVREDWEYWCRLASRGPIVYCGGEEPVLYYRRRKDSLYKKKGRVLAYHKRAIDAVFGNPVLMRRFSSRDQRHLRRAAEANSYYDIAQEHVRFADWKTARGFLAKSLLKKFNYKCSGVLFLALCGGAPNFLLKRFPNLRKYEFLE